MQQFRFQTGKCPHSDKRSSFSGRRSVHLGGRNKGSFGTITVVKSSGYCLETNVQAYTEYSSVSLAHGSRTSCFAPMAARLLRFEQNIATDSEKPTPLQLCKFSAIPNREGYPACFRARSLGRNESAPLCGLATTRNPLSRIMFRRPCASRTPKTQLHTCNCAVSRAGLARYPTCLQ